VWFSLRENHQNAYRFGLYQLRSCCRQDSDLRLWLHQQNARGVAFLDGKATWKKAAAACTYRRFSVVVHQPPGAATPGGEVSCSGF
jgi:hypothetical protein